MHQLSLSLSLSLLYQRWYQRWYVLYSMIHLSTLDLYTSDVLDLYPLLVAAPRTVRLAILRT